MIMKSMFLLQFVNSLRRIYKAEEKKKGHFSVQVNIFEVREKQKNYHLQDSLEPQTQGTDFWTFKWWQLFSGKLQLLFSFLFKTHFFQLIIQNGKIIFSF